MRNARLRVRRAQAVARVIVQSAAVAVKWVDRVRRTQAVARVIVQSAAVVVKLGGHEERHVGRIRG